MAPGAAPGDEVRIEDAGDEASASDARLMEVLRPAIERCFEDAWIALFDRAVFQSRTTADELTIHGDDRVGIGRGRRILRRGGGGKAIVGTIRRLIGHVVPSYSRSCGRLRARRS